MKTQGLGTGPPAPRISTSAGAGWALRMCIPTSSQVRLKLPSRDHTENHWSRRVQTAKHTPSRGLWAN